MKNEKLKKIIVLNIPYFIIGLMATKIGQAVRLAPGSGFEGKALHIMEGLTLAFEDIMPSFHIFDIIVGATIAAGIRLAVYVKSKNAKKYRKNEEYGSARWSA